jgi:hypothetical protein
MSSVFGRYLAVVFLVNFMIYIQAFVFGLPLTLCYLVLENNFYDLENESPSPYLEANDFDSIFIIAEKRGIRSRFLLSSSAIYKREQEPWWLYASMSREWDFPQGMLFVALIDVRA